MQNKSSATYLWVQSRIRSVALVLLISMRPRCEGGVCGDVLPSFAQEMRWAEETTLLVLASHPHLKEVSECAVCVIEYS